MLVRFTPVLLCFSCIYRFSHGLHENHMKKLQSVLKCSVKPPCRLGGPLCDLVLTGFPA